MGEEVQTPFETGAGTGDDPGVVGVDVQEDLVTSTRKLLAELNLIGSGEVGAASVSPIEADATKAAKFSAVAGAMLVALAWAALAIWWAGEETANQVAAIGGAALITAATVLGLAYLVITDIRSRTAAAVASTQAREAIALAMIEASAAARQMDADAEIEKARVAATTAAAELEAAEAARKLEPPGELVALPKKVNVKYLARRKGDKKGWTAIAIERRGEDELRYLLVRGKEKAMAEADEVSFI